MHKTFFKHDLPSRIDRALDKKREADAQERACKKVVDARDHRTCRSCGKHTDPDDIGLLRGHRHHIRYRSAGGKWEPENIVTLCAECHSDEHRSRLQIVASTLGANGALEFWQKDDDGNWFLWRRELSIGIFEKD